MGLDHTAELSSVHAPHRAHPEPLPALRIGFHLSRIGTFCDNPMRTSAREPSSDQKVNKNESFHGRDCREGCQESHRGVRQAGGVTVTSPGVLWAGLHIPPHK